MGKSLISTFSTIMVTKYSSLIDAVAVEVDEFEFDSSDFGSIDSDSAQSSNGIIVDFLLVRLDSKNVARVIALNFTAVNKRCTQRAIKYAHRCREEGVRYWWKIVRYVEDCEEAGRAWLLLHPDWRGHNDFYRCDLHVCVLELRS